MKTISLKKAAKKVCEGKAQFEADTTKEHLIEVLKFTFPKDRYDYEKDKHGVLQIGIYYSRGLGKKWARDNVSNLTTIKLSSIVDKPKWKNRISKDVADLQIEVVSLAQTLEEILPDFSVSQPKEEFVLPKAYHFEITEENRHLVIEWLQWKCVAIAPVGHFCYNDENNIKSIISFESNKYSSKRISTKDFLTHVYEPWKKSQEVKLNFEPENKVELNRWYWNTNKTTLCFVDDIDKYEHFGFYLGGYGLWDFSSDYNKKGMVLATTEEITSMLTEECKKRGIVKGAKVSCLRDGKEFELTGGPNTVKHNDEVYKYYEEDDSLYVNTTTGKNIIAYQKGRFAEVIEPAKEEVKESVIDWDKPQLLISNDKQLLVITNGESDKYGFEGNIVFSGIPELWSIGDKHIQLSKSSFKKLTEPVTLNPSNKTIKIE